MYNIQLPHTNYLTTLHKNLSNNNCFLETHTKMCHVTINLHLCGNRRDTEKLRTWCTHASEVQALKTLWTREAEFFSSAQREVLVELRRQCVAATEIWRATRAFVDCAACIAEFERLGAAAVARMTFDCVRLDTEFDLAR